MLRPNSQRMTYSAVPLALSKLLGSYCNDRVDALFAQLTNNVFGRGRSFVSYIQRERPLERPLGTSRTDDNPVADSGPLKTRSQHDRANTIVLRK